MRPRLNFEQLVQHNKNEILRKEKLVLEIERRLEKKHEETHKKYCNRFRKKVINDTQSPQ